MSIKKLLMPETRDAFVRAFAQTTPDKQKTENVMTPEEERAWELVEKRMNFLNENVSAGLNPHQFQIESCDNDLEKPKHYQIAIDPYEYALVNGLGMLEGNIIKYVTRRKGDKAKRLDDLIKARTTIERLIDHERKKANDPLDTIGKWANKLDPMIK
ncbi:MAG: DUF3310 domain-containing protein [Methyloprofundus sp.]|nr:DUF3310 domain-containing protein [Methyloprofundus sp.]